MAFSAKYVFMHVNHTVVERNCSEELSLRSPVTRKHKSSTGKVLKAEINLLHGIAVLGTGCSLPHLGGRPEHKQGNSFENQF